eukprot:s442_g7.t1
MTLGLLQWALAFPLVAVWMEVEVELELVEVAVAAWMMEVASSVVGSLAVSALKMDALWVHEGQIQQPSCDALYVFPRNSVRKNDASGP